MVEVILESVRTLGPMLVGSWLLTIVSVLLRPQRYVNSFLLMFALLVTLVFVTSCFGEEGPTFALISFFLVMLALLLVPLLLIINGIQMIRRESLCLAHCLSLGLGLFVGIGELAAIAYVFALAGNMTMERVSLWVMLLVWTVFYFSSLVLSFVVYSVFIQVLPHRMNFGYVIIHGCGLSGGEQLTKLLSNRVDKAIEIYEKCKVKPILIPSGGQGCDEKLSEAEAMGRYLIGHGIPEDHIVLEDRSATTAENLSFSKAIIDARGDHKRVALVSSNYHVYRCLRLAKEVGLHCTGIGADVALYYWPSALIREFVAVFLSRGFLLWSLVGYLILVSPILYALLR